VGGTSIPKDQGNEYLYGIEIESKGSSASVTAGPDDVDGFTPAQVTAAARAAAALVKLLGKDETAVIRHRDWAPGRKSDVLQPLTYWRGEIRAALHPPKPPQRVVLSDLVDGAPSESAGIVNRALVAAHYLEPALLRAYWSDAAHNAFITYREAGGFADNAAGFRALGRRYGFTVVP
jgi:hypothetical protein